MVKDYEVLRTTINNVLAESQLDSGGKYLVLKDIYRDAAAAYYGAINAELIAEANANAEGENDSAEVV